MEFHLSSLYKASLSLLTLVLLEACGGESSSSSESNASEGDTLKDIPLNCLPINSLAFNHHLFRDQDGTPNEICGNFFLKKADDPKDQVTSVSLYWADAFGDKNSEVWLKATASSDYKISIPANTVIPDNVNSFLMYAMSDGVESEIPTLIKFHDYIGNALVSGPGGIGDSVNNEGNDHPSAGDDLTREGAWYYGGLSENDRTKISIYRSDIAGGTCTFENGLVSVVDMENEKDTYWEANSYKGEGNIVNDVDYSAFSFLCDENNPINLSFEVPRIKDEVGAWTYSQLNDAMFYGTHVYDAFLKYLGEPPLEEKLRIRVHYGPTNNLVPEASWDGVYANFSDNIDLADMVSLDIIAHEIGHGVLSRISALKALNNTLSTDARTLHEAFGDMSGVVAKYEYTGELNWNHNEESRTGIRQLDKIVTHSDSKLDGTEIDAISSFLDYDDADLNPYLRIGMITYPFYLLTNKWGIEKAYSVILVAARNCWENNSSLSHAASCIKDAAADNNLPVVDVEEAFKAVKIKLFDEGVLSHFTYVSNDLKVLFTNNSQSTGTVNSWLWDFGDGQTSNLQNPEHTFVAADSYQVSLTVTDTNGDQDSFQRQVTVVE
jgi:hypothetical protein